MFRTYRLSRTAVGCRTRVAAPFVFQVIPSCAAAESPELAAGFREEMPLLLAVTDAFRVDGFRMFFFDV